MFETGFVLPILARTSSAVSRSRSDLGMLDSAAGLAGCAEMAAFLTVVVGDGGEKPTGLFSKG